MLRRLAALACVVALMTASARAASADDQIIKDEKVPGIDVIIKEPSSNSATGTQPTGPISAPRPVPTIDEWIDELCRSTAADRPGAIQDVQCASPEATDDEANDGPVDAAALARSIRERLDIPVPGARTSPAAPVKALVGLQTWLWVDPDQWQPLRLSASLGGTTVSVTARPVQARWDLGEGTRTCAGPGRAWRSGLGQAARTSCGFTYRTTSADEPGGRQQVSAVVRYAVSWSCTGDCSAPAGDLGSLDSVPWSAVLEVGERQSVVVTR